MKELKWGETPWDDLSKEELLREVQRMFSALQSAQSVLRILRVQDPVSLFWQMDGSGGRALNRIEQALDAVYQTHDKESLYRTFFRYAASLLFSVPDEEKWLICPTCGCMWSGKENARHVGTPHKEYPMAPDRECQGILRWLEWNDLAKEERDL